MISEHSKKRKEQKTKIQRNKNVEKEQSAVGTEDCAMQQGIEMRSCRRYILLFTEHYCAFRCIK